MPKQVSVSEAVMLGVRSEHSLMDNGEYRFRLFNMDGSAYIATKMPNNGGAWQNSHYHEGIVETYIVQSGWIGFAELLPGGKASVNVYRPGTMITSRPGLPHNVYMPGGALIHTVKHGDCSLQNDWHATPELDQLVKHLTEEDIFTAAKLTPAMAEELRTLAA